MRKRLESYMDLCPALRGLNVADSDPTDLGWLGQYPETVSDDGPEADANMAELNLEKKLSEEDSMGLSLKLFFVGYITKNHPLIL